MKVELLIRDEITHEDLKVGIKYSSEGSCFDLAKSEGFKLLRKNFYDFNGVRKEWVTSHGYSVTNGAVSINYSSNSIFDTLMIKMNELEDESKRNNSIIIDEYEKINIYDMIIQNIIAGMSRDMIINLGTKHYALDRIYMVVTSNNIVYITRNRKRAMKNFKVSLEEVL